MDIEQLIHYVLFNDYLNEVNEDIQDGHWPLHFSIRSIPNGYQVWQLIVGAPIDSGVVYGEDSDKGNVINPTGHMGRGWRMGLVESFDACPDEKTIGKQHNRTNPNPNPISSNYMNKRIWFDLFW